MDLTPVDPNGPNPGQECLDLGGQPNVGLACSEVVCDDCDPNEPGVSLLFSNIFRGFVCGTGCPALIIASILGLVTMKIGYASRRRRRR